MLIPRELGFAHTYMHEQKRILTTFINNRKDIYHNELAANISYVCISMLHIAFNTLYN